MATLDLLVQTGSDDAQEIAGTVVLTDATSVNDLDATNEYVGVRFDLATQGVTGPEQGATITAATLTVQVVSSATDEPLVTIFGEKSVSSATFAATASNISGRTKTTASVAWDNANLASGANQDFAAPSLVTVIQELVNQASWATTSPITLLIQGGPNGPRDLQFNMFETSQAAAPRLHLEFTNPAPGGAYTPRATLTGVG